MQKSNKSITIDSSSIGISVRMELGARGFWDSPVLQHKPDADDSTPGLNFTQFVCDCGTPIALGDLRRGLEGPWKTAEAILHGEINIGKCARCLQNS